MRKYRRKIKKRKNTSEKTKMKFTAVLVIIIMTIALGYATARFVIGPILGYDTSINLCCKTWGRC